MKEPWLAANLSQFFPGLGHYYAGSRGLGTTLILAQILLIGISVWGVFIPEGSVKLGLLCCVLAVVVYILGIWTAIWAVRRKGGQETGSSPSGKDPWLGVFLNRLLPGLGSFYLKQPGPGILFLFGVLVVGALSSLHPVLSVLLAPLVGFACYHAFAAAVHRPRSVIVVALLASVVTLVGGSTDWIRKNVIQAYRIPTSAMEPSLNPGDLILAQKLRLSPIERGDLIVFAMPMDPSRDSVKRVIGLPGERVEIRDRIVHINGKAMEENYVKFSGPEARRVGEQNTAIFPPGAGNADQYGPITVRNDEYFVLGDHRDNSDDSRFWGGVALKAIHGKAYKIYYPLSRAGNIGEEAFEKEN